MQRLIAPNSDIWSTQLLDLNGSTTAGHCIAIKDEPEDDDDDEDSTSGTSTSPLPPRKRQRLDHLSIEEKIMRRKLKNRVAAQTARDRKKIQMDQMEIQVQQLQARMVKIEAENSGLRLANSRLLQETADLKSKLAKSEEKLQQQQQKRSLDDVDVRTAKLAPFEYAEEARLECGGAGVGGCPSLDDDALRWLDDVASSQDILDILDEVLDAEFLDCTIDDKLPAEGGFGGAADASDQPTSPTAAADQVVGSAAEQLESVRELIRFDHVYNRKFDGDLMDSIVSANQVREFENRDSDDDNHDHVIIVDVDSMADHVMTEEVSVHSTSMSLQTPPIVEDDDQDDVMVLHDDYVDALRTVDKLDSKKATSSGSESGYDTTSSLLSPSTSDVNVDDEMMDDDGVFDSRFVELFPSLM